MARLISEQRDMERIFTDTTTDHSPNGVAEAQPWTSSTFGDLIDQTTGEIGRVVSSEKEPSGSHVFYFWADEAALTLDVGHIVVGFSEEAAVVAVVDEPRRYSDMQSFLDDYFDRHVELGLADIGSTQRPEILVFEAKVLATKHVRDDVVSKRPVINGPVYFATPEAIRFALGLHNFSGEPIPALMHTNGNYERNEATGEIIEDEHGRPRFQRTPIYLDEDYLLGPEAGHANWTGQSGLATKTSHALFLISSAFQTLEKEGKKVAALMFNVKGPDLLWLDKPAQPDEDHVAAYAAHRNHGLGQDDLDAYKALGLEPRPFHNTRIFAPFRPNHEPVSRSGIVNLDDFSKYKDLNTERYAPGETDKVYPVLWSLESALKFPHRVFSHGDLDDKLWGFIYELRELKVNSIAQLEAKFEEINQYFQETNEDTWEGHHKATIRKAQNRFKGLQDKLGGLLSHGHVQSKNIPTPESQFVDQELRVIDISQTNSLSGELLVTSIINEVWRMAERSELGVDKLIVFVDELNKYAPAGGEGGLRDTLVDIAARGRHLNVVLFGAQQFRSRVDGEILGNCGTSLYGRVGDEEIINAAYRSISETSKSELLGLPKGRLLIRHAHFREPLFGAFPMPPTIRGIDGQRVFGSALENGLRRPEDPLVRVIRAIMGDHAPPQAEIATQCEGVDPEAIDEVAQSIRREYSGGNHRGNAWRQAVKYLNRRRYGSNNR